MNYDDNTAETNIDIQSLLVLGNNENLLKWSMKKILYMN